MIMSIYKYINKQFDFLVSLGFDKKEYFEDGYELSYHLGDCDISILYYQGTDCSYSKKTCVEIIITLNGERQNILKCEKIDINKLQTLENFLFNKKPKGQIEIYARFIKENLNYLINIGKEIE